MSQGKISIDSSSLSITLDGNSVVVQRERDLTDAEKQADPDATVMAESVLIEFGDGEPKVSVNRVLCSDD